MAEEAFECSDHVVLVLAGFGVYREVGVRRLPVNSRRDFTIGEVADEAVEKWYLLVFFVLHCKLYARMNLVKAGKEVVDCLSAFWRLDAEFGDDVVDILFHERRFLKPLLLSYFERFVECV